MEQWQEEMRRSICHPDQLPAGLVTPGVEEVCKRYPMRVTPYYLQLLMKVGEPLARQVLPDLQELQDPTGIVDPLGEEDHSPVPNLTHRYPDRVLFLVTQQCSLYCRFCTRKRKVGDRWVIKEDWMERSFRYIQENPQIRDVIVSGGDPLVLSDEKLDKILARLRSIPHVQIIRVHSRTPCVLPQRITPKLVSVLKKYQPIFFNTHFNHPAELTQESREACQLLVDGGIPVGNQSVLLKGVNDDPTVMKELLHKLLLTRVRPYYLYQADLTQGTAHFRTPVNCGLEIMRSLRGHTSGLALPTYVIDAPGGGGKIPLLPESLVEENGQEIVLRNFQGSLYRYPKG